MKIAEGENTNPLFYRARGKKPIVSPIVETKASQLKEVYEYDLQTKVGGAYRLLAK